MSIISRLLQLTSGADRGVDLSTNTLSLGGTQLNGSTSGSLTQTANPTTTSYSIVWPAAQAAGSSYALFNDGSGNLTWASAASGANTSLSNLGTTSINADLLPSANLTRTLGSNTLVWSAMWIKELLYPSFLDIRLDQEKIYNHTGSNIIDAGNTLLNDNSDVLSIDWTNRLLSDTAAATQLSWSTSGIEFNQLTASTVPYLNASKILTSSAVTPAQLGYLSGATGTTGTGNLVLSASPTFTGTLAAAAASLSGALNMNSHQINNVANGTASGDAVNLGQLQAAISGTTWQGPAAAYSNANVPLTGSTPLVIDGYTVLNNDLVILGNQTTAAQNGEYSVAITGGSYVLTSNGLPSAAGDAWLILNGTVFADSAFVANAAIPSATFTQFAGPTSYTFTSPLLLTGRTVSIGQSTTSTNGYLSSTDWNTFNSKQAAGNYITALTGDATASGPGSAPLTLATVNTNTGSFGSSTAIPTFTVNGKGLITAAGTAAVVAPAGTLTGTTLAANVVTSSLTTVGTITSGTWNGTTIAIANGGTGQTSAAAAFAALSPLTTAGDIIFENATPAPARLAIGSNGQVLTVVSGLPAWAPVSAGTVTSVALADGSGTPIYNISGSPVTGAGTLTFTLATQAANSILAGPISGSAAQPTFRTMVTNDIANGIVTAAKLATVTDGITTDQSGSGSTIEVLNSPAMKRTLVAGQTFVANTSYAVRWGITANGETAGRVYAADITTSSFDLFYVIGMAVSAAGVIAGGNITVTSLGSFALSSADTAFGSGTDGEAVFLTASGTFSVTPPSTAGQAVTRIGIVQARSATVTSNIIDVAPQVIGVA